MGFFSGSTEQSSSMQYDNPVLRNYTGTYRNTAAYSFADLDPRATLMLMDNNKKAAKKFAGMRGQLTEAAKQEQDQMTASNDAMQRIQDRQKSGNFLTPQETDFINQQLDKAFESSRNIAYQDWEKGAQSLAGGRGLRTSDTPVAQPAMQAMRDMELGFSSQRAQQGLAATMQMSAQQNQFDADLMNSLNSLQLNRWNSRMGNLFGGGLSGASNVAYNTNQQSKTTQNMSGFQQVMAGFQMANAGLDLGKKIGDMGKSASIGLA